MATPNATSIPTRSHVYFRYQSHDIPFPVWVRMLTLCLAPLITHIAFGYGTPVLMTERRPKLLDRLSQFNPLTIIWRYYAILNRRVRAYDWDRADMAASNAVFWDGHRWDGSEQLMLQSRQWVTKLPQQNRVDLISSSTLATVAMTVQGVGALGRVIRAAQDADAWTGPGLGLTDIFNFMALLSLTRLPSALWISDEYGYDMNKRQPVTSDEYTSEPPIIWTNSMDPTAYRPLKAIGRVQISEANTEDNLQTSNLRPRLRPNSIYAARVLAASMVLLVLSGSVLALYTTIHDFSPRPFVIITQLSGLFTNLYYLVLATFEPLIYLFYIFKGHSGSTTLPCMNMMWYKCLNLVMILLAVLMFITTALETTILPNGEVVTYSVPLS